MRGEGGRFLWESRCEDCVYLPLLPLGGKEEGMTLECNTQRAVVLSPLEPWWFKGGRQGTIRFRLLWGDGASPLFFLR